MTYKSDGAEGGAAILYGNAVRRSFWWIFARRLPPGRRQGVCNLLAALARAAARPRHTGTVGRTGAVTALCVRISAWEGEAVVGCRTVLWQSSWHTYEVGCVASPCAYISARLSPWQLQKFVGHSCCRCVGGRAALRPVLSACRLVAGTAAAGGGGDVHAYNACRRLARKRPRCGAYTVATASFRILWCLCRGHRRWWGW